MSRPCAALAIALTVSLAGVSALHAFDAPANNPVPATTGTYISGIITNIDSVNNMIQVKDDTGIIQTIYINENVQILRRGESVRLVDLSLSDFVTVSSK